MFHFTQNTGTIRASDSIRIISVISSLSCIIVACNPESPSSGNFDPWDIRVYFQSSFRAVISHADKKNGSSVWSSEVIDDTIALQTSLWLFGNPKVIRQETDNRICFSGSVDMCDMDGIISASKDDIDTTSGFGRHFYDESTNYAKVYFRYSARNVPLVQHNDTVLTGYPSNDLSIYEITGKAVRERVRFVSWDSSYIAKNPVTLDERRVTVRLFDLQPDDSALLRVIFTYYPRTPSNKRVEPNNETSLRASR